jgi:hypothetical protein
LVPADFRGFGSGHLSAKGDSQLLGPKADSEDSNTPGDGLGKDGLLGPNWLCNMIPVGAPIGTHGHNEVKSVKRGPVLMIFSEKLGERISALAQGTTNESGISILTISDEYSAHDHYGRG